MTPSPSWNGRRGRRVRTTRMGERIGPREHRCDGSRSTDGLGLARVRDTAQPEPRSCRARTSPRPADSSAAIDRAPSTARFASTSVQHVPQRPLRGMGAVHPEPFQAARDHNRGMGDFARRSPVATTLDVPLATSPPRPRWHVRRSRWAQPPARAAACRRGLAEPPRADRVGSAKDAGIPVGPRRGGRQTQPDYFLHGPRSRPTSPAVRRTSLRR